MDPARWRILRPLLEQALDLDSKAERAEFLAALPQHQAEFRDELALLLQAHGAAPAMASPVAALAAQVVSADEAEARADSDRVGERVDDYRLLRLLGSGGMGAVYLAERAEGGFTHRVALKLVRSGARGGSARLRFAHERQVLAQLKHPNIAQLLDGGEADDGAPYFTMEYVDGDPITDYCRERGLGIAARLHLLIKVGAALAYAHRNLVVHRDIKPSNVLVDHEGRVKLLDFGIAKLLGDTPGGTLTQQRGVGPMTPEYAAPEQFRGGRITAATDVYQYGVLMFRLLSGRLPYRADVLNAAAWAHAVTGEEPLRLAQALDTRTQEAITGGNQRERLRDSVEPFEFRRLRRALRGDLEAIVRKALAKLPDERYRSMDAMVADLEAVIEGRPVSAQRASPWYSASRFVQRHRWSVALFATLMLALLMSTGFAINRAELATTAARQATAAAARAQREAERARAMQGFVADLFQIDDPGVNRGEALTANAMLETGAKRLASASFTDLDLRGELEVLLGRTYLALGETRRAHTRFEAALGALRQAPETTPLALANALERAAWAASRTGQNQLAEVHLREAHALAIPVDASSIEFQLNIRATEWSLHRDRGEVAIAAEIAADALALVRRYEPAAGSERTVMAMTRQGTVMRDMGHYAEAEQALLEAHQMAQRLYGDGDLRTVGAYQTLGWVYLGMGRLDAASEVLEAVGLRIKAMVGARTLRYAVNLHNRGLLYTQQHNHERARAAFAEAESIYNELAGPDSVDRGWALTNVGWSQARLHDYAAAASTFELLERVWRVNIPDDSVLWPANDYSLARAYHGLGDQAKATLYIERSLRRYRELGAKMNYELLRSLILQAAILRANGEAQAASALEPEIASLRQSMPENARDIEEWMADLR